MTATDAISQAAYERFRSVRFFSCLDGLRALSILAVIWHHTAAAAMPAERTLLQMGNRGVMLFFAISAFLISTLLLRAKERGALNVPRFWARRALRIMPLFYGVLALYVVAVICFEREAAAKATFFGNLPAFATFTSNWLVELDDARVIFYFAWSLAAEEQFYLCWPWIERCFAKMWPVIVALATLAIAQTARFLLTARHSDAFALEVLASIPAAILCGVVLAHALNSRRGFARIWVIAGRRGAAPIAAVVAIGALQAEPALGFFGELVTALALTGLVAACVVREDNALAPILRFPPIAWIGTVSYGIYLVHMLSIGVVRRGLAAAGLASPYLDFAGGALLAIAVASVSYLTFERYFLGLKERWFSEEPGRTTPESIPSAAPAAGAKRANAAAPG